MSASTLNGRDSGIIPKMLLPPTNKIRSGCLALAFSGAQKRAEMLRHPCILGDPQRQARGAKSEVVPNKGEQNQEWLPHPCLLRGPKEGGNATSPLQSRGSPNSGSKRALTGAVENTPSRGSQIAQVNPTTSVP